MIGWIIIIVFTGAVIRGLMRGAKTKRAPQKPRHTTGLDAVRTAPRQNPDIEGFSQFGRDLKVHKPFGIAIRYVSAEGEVTCRLVDITYVNGNKHKDGTITAIHFSGFCHTRQAVRTFYFARIEAAAEPDSGNIIPHPASYVFWKMGRPERVRRGAPPLSPEQQLAAARAGLIWVLRHKPGVEPIAQAPYDPDAPYTRASERQAFAAVEAAAPTDFDLEVWNTAGRTLNRGHKIDVVIKYKTDEGELTVRKVRFAELNGVMHKESSITLLSLGGFCFLTNQNMTFYFDRIKAAADPYSGKIIVHFPRFILRRFGRSNPIRTQNQRTV